MDFHIISNEQGVQKDSNLKADYKIMEFVLVKIIIIIFTKIPLI